MGWKSVRDHYGIRHIVKLVDGDVHIGSSYVGDLVVVKPDGRATLNRAFDRRGDIGAIMDAIEADRALFSRLLAAEDVFERSIPVYSWKDGRIVERLCEEPGWPNVTHDGHLMHDNTHYADRAEALRQARRSAESAVEAYSRHVREAEEELERRMGLLHQAIGEQWSLGADEDATDVV